MLKASGIDCQRSYVFTAHQQHWSPNFPESLFYEGEKSAI